MGRAVLRALTRLINVAEFPCTRSIIGGKIFGRLLVEIGKLDRDLKIGSIRWSNACCWYINWNLTCGIGRYCDPCDFLGELCSPREELSGRIILRSLVRSSSAMTLKDVGFRVELLATENFPHYIIRNVVAEVENNRWIFSHRDGTKFNEIRMLYGDEFSLGLKLM